MSRLLIVANRLPVTVERRKGEFKFRSSVGGLATGLDSLRQSGPMLWIGWAETGATRLDMPQRARSRDELRERYDSLPVFLSPDDISGFYHGFSNRTLWPLFHYFPRYAEFNPEFWRAYERANRKYRDAVLETYEPGDSIWVHDYLLMLLPELAPTEAARRADRVLHAHPVPLVRTVPHASLETRAAERGPRRQSHRFPHARLRPAFPRQRPFDPRPGQSKRPVARRRAPRARGCLPDGDRRRSLRRCCGEPAGAPGAKASCPRRPEDRALGRQTGLHKGHSGAAQGIRPVPHALSRVERQGHAVLCGRALALARMALPRAQTRGRSAGRRYQRPLGDGRLDAGSLSVPVAAVQSACRALRRCRCGARYATS